MLLGDQIGGGIMTSYRIRVGILLFGLCGPVWAQAPAPPAVPQVILPSKQDDSRLAARRDVPRELLPLASLTTALVAWFPMDSTERGGLRWSRKPIDVSASSKIAIRTEAGRTYADFNATGAKLSFSPPLELGRRYTLAGWVQTPVPQHHGVVWHGNGGTFLFVQKQSLDYWDGDANKGGVYARTAAPLAGWLHLAVVCDGNTTTAYLNGAPLDAAKGSLARELRTIGNSPDAQHHHWMMAGGLDEHFIFDRPLTAVELKRLMEFSQPKGR